MPVGTGRTIHKGAEILLAQGGSALSIINRSYYAMFYAVLALLELKGVSSAKHSGVISLFDKIFVKEGVFPKEMSHDLHRAFNLRLMADYRELVKYEKDEEKEILSKARDFASKVKDYLSRTTGE
ncbi:HEPN domain-containing protein [Candidatus Sumerlaeota bacterium]|nr:HEPN domain-containing protein [Candidatus Sumerlaeota bacterium]